MKKPSYNNKFRSRIYLKAIKKERYCKFADPDTYIYPESVYKLLWDDFFLLSGLPIEVRQIFKEKFINHYIHSNRAFDPYKQILISYRELSILKIHFPTNYTNFLLNYQYQLLQQKYNMYGSIPKKVKKKFVSDVYDMTDSSVESIDKFYESYGKSYKTESFLV